MDPPKKGFSKERGEPLCNGTALPKDLKPDINKEFLGKLLKLFVRRFSRGFASGVGLYSGVKIVFALSRNPFRESPPKILQGILNSDCARVAAFFSLYPSVYHLLVELLTVLRKRKDGWTYGVSGGVAGLTVAVLDNARRQTLAFFTLSRALGAGLSTLVARGLVTAVPYLEVYVFSACVSLIMYCACLNPAYLNQGYYRSIIKWSRDYTQENLQTLFRDPAPRFLTCEEGGLHNGPCVQHRLTDLFRSLPGFAKLYLPIYITPILVFKRKMLMDRPLDVLQSLARNIVLSASFLGVMVFLGKVNLCVLRNLSNHPPPVPAYIPAIAGTMAGIALFLERYSRRKELTLFVIPHVLHILYTIAKSSKLWPYMRIPHGFTIIFALSMTSVMHAYEREPGSLTSLNNGLLRFFVGA